MNVAKEACRVARESIDLANFFDQLKILGETPEERETSLRLMEGLTPAEIQRPSRSTARGTASAPHSSAGTYFTRIKSVQLTLKPVK